MPEMKQNKIYLLESGSNKISVDGDNTNPRQWICLLAEQAREIIFKSLETDIFEKFKDSIYSVTKDGHI